MALLNVQHKPITGTAGQFTGTITSITDILAGRPTANTTVVLRYDAAGALAGLQVSGGAFGSLQLALNDWAVFPTDTTKTPYAVTNATAGTDWLVI